ncbi:MAG: hypothetical protein HPY71_11255 [Firmicutes bacterium]|nr:hypothetical protein [Bacillota bacterium]
MKQYIGARFDDERVRLERLGDLLHKRFGDFTGICVSTPSELKSPGSWASKSYTLPVTFFYEDAVSKEASLLVELDKDESGSWRIIDVEISG